MPMDVDSSATTTSGLTVCLMLDSGETIRVPADVISKCKTIINMVEDFNCDDMTEIPVPFPDASAAIVQKIVDFCAYHHVVPPTPEEAAAQAALDPKIAAEREAARVEAAKQWNKDFCDTEVPVMVALLKYADYASNEELLAVVGQKIADWLIECKGTEAIRQKFGIVNDFTPEEEKQVIEENAWCIE